MTVLRNGATAALVAALVLVAAVFVFRAEPEATWLRVEAPAAVVVGAPLIATVTLLEPADGAFLHIDLHATGPSDSPVRVAAAGTTQAVASGQRTFTFSLVLRDRPDVSRVHAIVFLSRSGRWSDAFRVARSDSLAVVRGTPRAEDLVARPLRTRDQHEAPAIDVATAPLVRTAIAALWLGAAFIAARTWQRLPGGSAAGGFVVVCLALAAWEALAAGPWIAEHARPLARSAGLYEARRIAQQLGTIALVGVAGLLAVVGLRRSRLPGLVLAGLALYVVVSLADMLSLHEIDRLLATGIGPWPLADLLRLTGACATVAGAALRARTRNRFT
jgi:hypothetical protein